MDIHAVLKAQFVQALARRVCGDQTVLVERPAAYVLRNAEEDARVIDRLIVLPPQGYTANQINQTNSYAEVERATIAVKGAVRPGKKAFSKIRDCLLVVSFNDASLVSDLDKPYLVFNLEDPGDMLTRHVHSSGTPPFHVVRPDGTGVYHTLINLSPDWLVMQLHKVLHPQKEPDLSPHLAALQDEQVAILNQLWRGIVEQGDELFSSQPKLVDAVVAMPPSHSLPALAEMLHVKDTGKHEACTAFAVILKIGKRHPKVVKAFLAQSSEQGATPPYYAQQLIEKIERAQSKAAMSSPIKEQSEPHPESM